MQDWCSIDSWIPANERCVCLVVDWSARRRSYFVLVASVCIFVYTVHVNISVKCCGKWFCGKISEVGETSATYVRPQDTRYGFREPRLQPKLVVAWFVATISENSRCLLLIVSGPTRSSCSVPRWLRNICMWGLEDDSDADIYRANGSHLQRFWSEELLSAHALLVIIDVITGPYRHYRNSQISYGQCATYSTR